MPICQPSQGHKLCAPADIPSSLGPPPGLTQTVCNRTQHSSNLCRACPNATSPIWNKPFKHVISKLKETKDHTSGSDLVGSFGRGGVMLKRVCNLERVQFVSSNGSVGFRCALFICHPSPASTPMCFRGARFKSYSTRDPAF
jgi:hypothetical protein